MERRAGRRSSSLANLRMKPRERPPRSPTRAPWPDRLTAPAPEAATAGDLPEPGPLNGEGSLRQRMDAEWGQGPGAEDPQEDTPRAEIQDKGPVAGQGRGDQGFEGDVKRRGRLSPRAAGVAAGFYTGRRALTADLSTSKAPGRRATPSRDEVAPELGGKSELQEASRGAHASTHLTRKELQHSSPTSNRAGAGRGRGSSGCACPTAESLGRTLGSGGAGETLVGGGAPGSGTPGSCTLCQGQLPCGDRAQCPTRTSTSTPPRTPVPTPGASRPSPHDPRGTLGPH